MTDNNIFSTDTKMHICRLCPRNCGAKRDSEKTLGYCNVKKDVMIARYSLHMWEEPCISGINGSGTIFFSGCNLKCVFCQNILISRGKNGQYISEEELLKIIWELKKMGAHNINFVTPSHYIDAISRVIEKAKSQGFDLPFIYNTSSYEKVTELKKLDGLIDIYLPDFKYYDPELAYRMSGARDYPDIAKAALEEMIRQTGECRFDLEMLKKGTIVRNLILPLQTKNSRNIVKYLFETYGSKIYISLMSQYTPPENKQNLEKMNMPELTRKLTKREYDNVVNYALELGVVNAFIQDGQAASESFIPDFLEEIVIPD